MEPIPLRRNPSRKSRSRPPAPELGQNPVGLVPDVFSNARGHGQKPPKFVVNLSLPPEKRYSHIVPSISPKFKDASLTKIFDELIGELFPSLVVKLIHFLTPILLRRVYDDEEMAELRGIARDTNIPLYLLVAFNVLLDPLLGCTSGGVRVQFQDSHQKAARIDSPAWRYAMLHFRTLDWGMESLRHLVVELDFVRRAGGPVVATSVTYFGYVGVLTGVREGLSMSLNFRPHHDTSTWRKVFSIVWHQLCVVLGTRRSISSVLRQYLLAPDARADREASGRIRGTKGTGRQAKVAEREGDERRTPDMAEIISELQQSPSSSAYLIFCTPDHVYSIQKDNRAASVRSREDFLTTYNHDQHDEEDPAAVAAAAARLAACEDAIGMRAIVDMSVDRKTNVDRVFCELVDRRSRRLGRKMQSLGPEDVLPLVQDEWIINEETHYAVIMEPAGGRVLWCRVYPPDHD